MAKKGVLVVTHPLAPASESHVESLLGILSAITSVALVTTNLSSESPIREEYSVCEISGAGVGHSIVIAAFRFLRNQFRMCRVIASRDEGIVLFFGATAYLLPIAFARLIGKTVVLEPRGNVPLTLRLQWEQKVPSSVARGLAGLVWGLERIGYWLADGIVTYTPSMAEELGLMKYETKLYPNGARYVDTETFCPQTPFEDRECAVGLIGRLDEEKGIRTLADVATQLPPEITFRFIGDGELRPWLEQELATEIESGSVEIVGWVDHDEVPAELSRLRLLVLPSQPTEGLPTVILESMACGTPVYATPVSGVPDVVREGKTGFLIDDGSSKTLTYEIERIFKGKELTIMSRNCRDLAVEEYNYNAAVSRYREILSAVV